MEENKKIKVSFKVVIALIIIVVIIGIAFAICILKNSSNDNIISKAQKIYGDDFCPKSLSNSINYEDKEHSMTKCDVMSKYTCKICGKEKIEGHEPTPVICKDCATITNRCQECGKLLKIKNSNEKTSKITDEMLIGDWEFKNATDKSGNEISSMEIFGSLGTNGYFTFSKNERFTNNLTGGVSSEFIDEGKYTIKNDTTIELNYDDRRKGELAFSEKDGNKVLIETENNYILYLSKRTSSYNQNDVNNNSDLIGKWNTYEVVDSKTAKVLEPGEVFGSGYRGTSYLELKEDGTFKDFISPILSSEFVDEGKYEIQRNYNRNGDCYVILNYLDGRSLTLQKEYLSSDNIPSLVIPVNSEGDYEYHLKK